MVTDGKKIQSERCSSAGVESQGIFESGGSGNNGNVAGNKDVRAGRGPN
jgi:hypothetical protein